MENFCKYNTIVGSNLSHRITQWMFIEHCLGIMEGIGCKEGVQRYTKNGLLCQGAYTEVAEIGIYKNSHSRVRRA